MISVPLIINGDDFGASSAVNRAIIRAHQEGILTSASLMVNEPAADEAVRLAREHSGLSVGLHLVVVLGRSALPPSEIPHLVNEEGFFHESSLYAGLRYYFSPAARRELRREIRAQFERFAATGLPLSHVDGHTHLHMHPTVFNMMIELCEEFRVRRVRVVRDDFALNMKLDPRYRWRKRYSNVIFQLLARHCDKCLRGRGLESLEKVYGFLQSGDMNEEFLFNLVSSMNKVSTEIYAHPLMSDAPRAAGRAQACLFGNPVFADETLSNPGGAGELEALLSSRIRRVIEERGFVLKSHDDRAEAAV